MNKRLLALDIGGSKTRIQVLDTELNILCEICGAGVASAVEDPAPLPLLDELLSKIPHSEQIVAGAINLGGRNTGQVRNTFLSHFPNALLKIFRESEGTAAYALGDEYDAPIILMAGTGAIAVGKSQGLVTLDVSSLSGKYYIGFCNGQTADSVRLFKAWVEFK